MKLQLLTMAGCLHCAEAKKVLEEIKPDFPELKVEEIDVTSKRGQKMVPKYGIMASPGIVIGGELFSSGGLDKEKLIKRLKKITYDRKKE